MDFRWASQDAANLWSYPASGSIVLQIIPRIRNGADSKKIRLNSGIPGFFAFSGSAAYLPATTSN